METRDKDQPAFYYNREKRLEKASGNARFVVDHYGKQRQGVIKTLTATPGLMFLFFTVVFMIMAALVLGFIAGRQDSGSVDGNAISAKALWFEGNVYVTIRRERPLFGGSRRSAVEIKAGDGLGSAIGLIQATDEELRLRFATARKPDRIAIIASAARSDGTTASIELAASVE
ncbi:MAG TPA: hypothetical protein VMX33_02010 [bacterium]|nr:hypothetical protein [bacterium]